MLTPSVIANRTSGVSGIGSTMYRDDPPNAGRLVGATIPATVGSFTEPTCQSPLLFAGTAGSPNSAVREPGTTGMMME